MVSWRKKICGRVGGAQERPSELITPAHFRCPISLDLMKDPVTLSTGITYDRESIERWIEQGNITCPVTNQVLRALEPVPNHTIRRMIQDWCVENRSHGVERIPTPRIPITSDEVIDFLGRMSMTRGVDECKQMVGRLSRMMKESERNRRCIVANGAASALATKFESFAQSCEEKENIVALLEDLMSSITLMLPLDQVTLVSLKSNGSFDRLVWFLQRGGLTARRNAVMIIKQIVSSSRDEEKVVEKLVEVEGALEGLVKLVKEPICPPSTKASLVVIYNMITSSHPSSSGRIVVKLVNMDLVSLLLDTLVDAEKGICEKALGVLDALCRHDVGREQAYNHALTVPVVVKKILRVSDMATEFSVSVLWRLIENEKRESGVEKAVVECLQVGAFQKLLLILQVGWNTNERTKDRVTKLMKVLNVNRGKVECIESMDFKDLKRSF